MKIQINKNIFESVYSDGDLVRNDLSKKGVILFDFISSSGGGKTSIIKYLYSSLKDEFNVKIYQGILDEKEKNDEYENVTYINTSSLCSITSSMTSEILKNEKDEVILLENISNSICTNIYDSGANYKIFIFSTSDGIEKVDYYKNIIKKSDLVIVSKMDCKEIFQFDLNECEKKIKKIKDVKVVTFNKNGENLDLYKWIKEMIQGANYARNL